MHGVTVYGLNVCENRSSTKHFCTMETVAYLTFIASDFQSVGLSYESSKFNKHNVRQMDICEQQNISSAFLNIAIKKRTLSATFALCNVNFRT